MTIENLDQSKRDALESGTATPYVQDEALRIIDQLTAALEANEHRTALGHGLRLLLGEETKA